MAGPRPQRFAMPIVIAHRGASGYLPEHSLAAKALAHASGAAFLEQDVVATRDDQCVVLHDIHVDRVTDVAIRFPGRARDDGRFYARDFDLEELKQLRLTERTDAAGKPVFPERFPAGPTGLTIPTLSEELALISGLNRSTGREVGVYPEIKRPAWHHEEGVDLAALVLDALAKHGYRDHPEEVFLQCFDLKENIRIREQFNPRYPMVQLIADDTWGESTTRYSELLTEPGLVGLKGVVNAIGPWIEQLYTVENEAILETSLVEWAHALDLRVHPYTLRRDALPRGFTDFQALHAWLMKQGIDGVFSDFADLSVSLFTQLGAENL
ncbi:MAG: glycerophosphodiester phosphodiesterase [Pseudomonadota bacterium]